MIRTVLGSTGHSGSTWEGHRTPQREEGGVLEDEPTSRAPEDGLELAKLNWR